MSTETRIKKLPIQYRYLELQPQTEEQKQARTMSFSVSSEYPCDRWYGTEILDHSPESIDLSDFNDGAPVLFDHDTSKIVGVVESPYLGDRKLGIKMRFGNTAIADEVYQNCVDGILKKVSIGYSIQEMRLDDPENDVYRAVKWKPLEASFVAIPADPTVGIGRSSANIEYDVKILDDNIEREIPLPESIRSEPEMTLTVTEPTVDDVREILAMGKRYEDLELANELIQNGTSLADAKTRFLDKLSERSKQSPISESPVLGFTKENNKEFSMLRAIRDHVEGRWHQSVFNSFEKECSDEMAKRMGKESSGILLPLGDLTVDRATLQRSMPNFRSPYATNTPASGGNLVQTTLDAANFYDVLRNIPMLFRIGANSLTGLVGNIAIPRRTGVSTAYWVAEGQGLTESRGSFGQLAFLPKTLGVLTSITRQMMLQSTPDIEQLTRMDLLMVMALEIDRAGIYGSGLNNEPRGILNTAGIGNVTDGSSGTTLSFNKLVQLETIVSDLNADFEGSRTYLTNAKGVGTMKGLTSTTGYPLWIGSEDLGLQPGTPGIINGYPVARSNQIPKNLTKGSVQNLSAIIYGDFSQLWYAFWGTLEILPNPYGKGYDSGSIEMRVLQTMDIQLRRVEAFAAITDLITT